jgi:PIN domain nuclease of toxin-antitoxin system
VKYLLDTHIMIWWLIEPKKIAPKARHIMEDKKQEVFISSVSFWEIAIKQSLGRLTIPADPIEILTKEGFQLLALTAHEALSVVDLPMIHGDPFDRMLVMQSKLNDLVLITSDKKIMEYPVPILKA